MRRSPIDYDIYTEAELLEMTKKEATEGLTELQQRFCEEYVRSYNIRMAAIKAGYPRILKSVVIDAATIIDQHLRIAFSDITDFVDIKPTSIRLKPSELVDGQLVKSIKSGRDGVSIELYDKMRSLDFLTRYCEDMPKDWKQRIEERRIELQEKEFELKKKINDVERDAEEKDGFIEAIENATEAAWDD